MASSLRNAILFIQFLYLCGCAPNILIGPVHDLSAGLQKSVQIEVQPRGANVVADRLEFQVEALRGVESTDAPNSNWLFPYRMELAIPSSEDAHSGAKVRITYSASFRRFPFFEVEQCKAQYEATVLAAARLEVKMAPSCLILGQSDKAAISVNPIPHTDTFLVRIVPGNTVGTVGISLGSEGALSTSSLSTATILATGIGKHDWRIGATNRKEILASELLSTTVLPAVQEPLKLTAVVGEYSPPPEGSEGQPNLPPAVRTRDVVFSWSNAVGAQRTAIRVFEANAQLPIQESLVTSDSQTFKASLEVGKSYYWDARSQFATCDGTAWSVFSKSPVFAVQN